MPVAGWLYQHHGAWFANYKHLLRYWYLRSNDSTYQKMQDRGYYWQESFRHFLSPVCFYLICRITILIVFPWKPYLVYRSNFFNGCIGYSIWRVCSCLDFIRIPLAPKTSSFLHKCDELIKCHLLSRFIKCIDWNLQNVNKAIFNSIRESDLILCIF